MWSTHLCVCALGELLNSNLRGSGLFPPSLAYFDLNHVGSETVKDVSNVAVQIGGTNATCGASADGSRSFRQPSPVSLPF